MITACPSGKVAYPNPQAAHRALALIRRRVTRHDGHAYRCPDCRMWHLSSAKPSEAR
jgi:predicted RNA-binding Zn-ribbon protein involved in translation (DUF1610 family)